MLINNKYPWLKSKGYLHLSPKIEVTSRRSELIGKIKNEKFISQYSFLPLVHSVIKERRYKKIPGAPTERAHSYLKKGKTVRTAKERPLHYASHMDALVFGYYADMLYKKYDAEIRKNQELSDCVTAYRKMQLPDSTKHKGTIHFANEVFEEIKKRGAEDCIVLKFDIKSFFNRMDHGKLKSSWMDIMGFTDKMPGDHYNVFKGATRFSYVMRDNFRNEKHLNKNGRRVGFDEKRLATIRNKNGLHSFYDSAVAFREAVKTGQLKIYRFPFRNDEGEVVGIPQGLPISAVLANLYLLPFDKTVFDFVVTQRGGFYRRYSDDIIVICKVGEEEIIKEKMFEEIKERKVEISPEKTETFLFKNINDYKGNTALTSIMIHELYWHVNMPLTYLGFEFYGYRTAIKSANLSKFYRRMIFSVKRKVKRAVEIASKTRDSKVLIFRRQLYRLYTLQNLNVTKPKRNAKWIEPDEKGGYRLRTKPIESKFQSNYLTYVKRVSRIMNDASILRQIRRHTIILQQAISKYLKINLEKNK